MPSKAKTVTKMDLPGLPRPVKMSSFMKRKQSNAVMPSCQYRRASSNGEKETGGYYDTCLT